MKYLIAILVAAISIVLVHADDNSHTATIKNKLEIIILPDITFDHTPLQNALNRIKLLSVSTDSETDVTKKGINIVLKLEQDSVDLIKITTSLKQPTLGQALSEIAKQSECNIEIESWGAVALIPKK